MKNFALVLCLLLGLASNRASAVPSLSGFLQPLKIAVSNELNTATNTSEPDKKLVSGLNKALTFLDRASDTDLAADLKIFSQVSATLAKIDASTSANLDSSVTNVFEDYLEYVWFLTVGSSNRLQNSYASKTRTAAEKNIGLVFKYLSDANALDNLVSAAKLLSKAGLKWRVADGLVDKALDVPAPADGFSANITGDVQASFKPTQIIPSKFPNAIRIIATQTILSRSNPGVRTIDMNLGGIVDGQNTLTIGQNSTTAVFSNLLLQNPGEFPATSGTINCTLNSAAETVTGTFNFSGNGVTVTGSFSVKY